MTNYLVSGKDNTCYGCRACEQICPKNAITMKPNKEGFAYPVLDADKCVKCGLCAKICPHDNPMEAPEKPVDVFAGQYLEEEALLGSSSGGIFSAVADYVLANDGYVAGCLFDEDFVAVHMVTNEKKTVEKMRGSKYVQSDTKDTYAQIKALLDENKLVLFSGTPCQVDGLKRYLRKDYQNLITMDLICHGVPSPYMLSTYLDTVRAKKGPITQLSFRNKKRNGWGAQGSIGYGNKVKSISRFNNSYYYYYLQNSISRKCCYECKYSSVSRVGDITVGDFWGAQDVLPELNVEKGVSAVLANTDKGLTVLNELKQNLLLTEVELETVAQNNGNLVEPCQMPKKRNEIYARIQQKGYDAIAKEECHFQYVVPFIRMHIPKSLKKALKRVRKG